MIQIQDLKFRYPGSDFELVIDSLQIAAGEKVAIVGPSGSGKTTLLNLISGIHVPERGELMVDGQVVSSMTDRQRRNFRVAKIGMVFQQFELIEYLTALDNILTPFWINRSLELTSADRQFAGKLARTVGIEDKLQRRPAKISQGEQQRVAICRALISRPRLILADEPTGNLDPKNKSRILEILFEQAVSNGQTLLVVTHDMGILAGFDRTIDFAQFRVEDRPAVQSGEVAP
jgi:putative ABC transport system ATP-binding protein